MMEVWDVRQDDEVEDESEQRATEDEYYCKFCGEPLETLDDIEEGYHVICPFERQRYEREGA